MLLRIGPLLPPEGIDPRDVRLDWAKYIPVYAGIRTEYLFEAVSAERAVKPYISAPVP